MKSSNVSWFVPLAVAAACGAPANSEAQAQKHMGFECRPDVLLQGGNGVPIKIGDKWGANVKTADECLALCNKTQGCIAVSIIIYEEAGKPVTCSLFSKVITMQKYASYDGWKAMATCVKAYPTKTLDGPPKNYIEIPPNFPHDRYQDQDRPGPAPGGKR